MSFQAYITNIETKTGKSSDAFLKLATEKGFIENGILKPEIKAGTIVAWLKEEYGLGHGHAMAMYAFFKGKRE